MSPAPLRIVVMQSPAPRAVLEHKLELPPGATVRMAVVASGLAADWAPADWEDQALGIWGRKAHWEQVLRDGDRVEIYRALLVDPKTARRERFARQGRRVAGLFEKRSSGDKPGGG